MPSACRGLRDGRRAQRGVGIGNGAAPRSCSFPSKKDLVTVMGELATSVDDLPRYVADEYPVVTAALTEKLDALVTTIESQSITFKGWATPGGTADAAALDLARVTARKAERRVCALQEADQLRNTRNHRAPQPVERSPVADGAVGGNSGGHRTCPGDRLEPV